MRWFFLVALVSIQAFAQDADEATPDVPSRLSAPPILSMKSLPAADDLLAHMKLQKGKYVLERGALTLDAQLQQQLTEILEQYETPYAAVVAMEPKTGRVLAMAEHAAADPSMRGLCTKAIYPAASIYKLVTSAALLDTGLNAEDQVCYHGGKRKLTPALLEDGPNDGRCHTLGSALGASANVVFAKLTARYLDADRLMRFTRAFKFNTPLQFPVPTEMSLAAVPDESFPLALTGAGFGDVYLSPLHGAAMAATLANGGLWRQPVLFESDVATAPAPERVLPEPMCTQLNDMMEATVTSGTARKYFRERGHRVDGAVGKTGSLADKTPFHDYTWFVGFAPKVDPKISVAAVIVNDPHWRIRAAWLGREALRLFLDRHAQVERIKKK